MLVLINQQTTTSWFSNFVVTKRSNLLCYLFSISSKETIFIQVSNPFNTVNKTVQFTQYVHCTYICNEHVFNKIFLKSFQEKVTWYWIKLLLVPFAFHWVNIQTTQSLWRYRKIQFLIGFCFERLEMSLAIKMLQFLSNLNTKGTKRNVLMGFL